MQENIMISSRKLTNNKDDVEKEMMEAILGVYPGIFVDTELRIAMLNRERFERVALLSGGGSGHEPFPVGFVGEGMLTSAVAGKVFTSPPTANILSAILTIAKLNKGGILLLLNNYTGDVLNFACAMEVARSKGCNIESVIVSDDVSQCGTVAANSLAGRRGMVGIILVAKILGSYSEEGKGLAELVKIGSSVNKRLGTLGICLHPCTLPGSYEPMFNLEKDNIEFGVGIHGEAGIATINVESMKDLVKQMLKKIMSHLALKEKDHVVITVNNLGSLSQMEMLIITREVKLQIEEINITVDRIYEGALVTSIDMRGFQICLLNITYKEHWLNYLDKETEAFAWPGSKVSYKTEEHSSDNGKIVVDDTVSVADGMLLDEKSANDFAHCLLEIFNSLNDNAFYLDKLDTVVGDGDCGTTFQNFAKGSIKELVNFPLLNIASTFAKLSKLAERLMGGTSGAIFSLLFMGAAKRCKSWTMCWSAAIEMVQKYSRARLGDRTLLDAMIPAYNGFEGHLKDNGDQSWPAALKIALDKAEEGCQMTKKMIPRAGRASYVDPAKVKDVDPGAYAIVLILRAINRSLVLQHVK